MPFHSASAKHKPLLVVADAGEAVFTPAIRAGAGLIVREVVPRISVGAVVLADRAPLSFAQVGPPALPRCLALARCLEPVSFNVSAHAFLGRVENC